jgi:tRNA pseudouridine55 synthase
MDKVHNVYKPKGIASTQFLNQIKYDCKQLKIKIGHGGTLDPLASGILMIGIGKGTKQLNEFLKCKKTYQAHIKLGSTSTTLDEEGEKNVVSSYEPTLDEIKKVSSEFIGEIDQIPPNFSAAHVNGERAYVLARKGKEIKLESRKVTIYDISFIEYEYPLLKISVTVSGGTYIRVLAEDIGKSLKTGAYLADLISTKINDTLLINSIKKEYLTSLLKNIV